MPASFRIQVLQPHIKRAGKRTPGERRLATARIGLQPFPQSRGRTSPERAHSCQQVLSLMCFAFVVAVGGGGGGGSILMFFLGLDSIQFVE